MKKRLFLLGVFLAVAGLAFGVAAAVAYAKVQDGYDSLQAISEQQNVTLSYNDNGQLIDRGETAERRGDHVAVEGRLAVSGRRR